MPRSPDADDQEPPQQNGPRTTTGACPPDTGAGCSCGRATHQRLDCADAGGSASRMGDDAWSCANTCCSTPPIGDRSR